MFKNKMSILSQSLLTLGAMAIANTVQANEVSNDINWEQIQKYNKINSMGQVTSVDQLSDVSPTDWAYEALRSLVERYGCIVGYPDSTFRGNRALSRYEFAAGLNACMEQMERLLAASEAVIREDIEKLQRLAKEFEAELAYLGERVDNLEGRVAFLEDHQFSTTTKLYGEVALTLAQAFGDDVDAQAVFNNRVRLQLSTSFTGKDVLYTRLTAGNVGNSFADEIGTNEGRFAYDGQRNNDVTIDRLHYYFPVINDDLKVFVMANLGGHHFYADTFNSGLDAGGGARNSLSRFGERNPIYRLGLGGQGIGITYKPDSPFEFSAGYLARGGNDPADGRGLFNGNFSAMAQLVYKPTDRLKFGFNYLRGYDPQGTFALGGTGTFIANDISIGGGVESNSYGIQGKFDVTPKFSIRAWGGYIDAKVSGGDDAEIWTYAVALAFPDLGKEGALGYVLAGAEPYDGNFTADNETPFHIELAYRYPVTDGIAITPGLIILTNPDQGAAGDAVYIGTLRTVFNF